MFICYILWFGNETSSGINKKTGMLRAIISSPILRCVAYAFLYFNMYQLNNNIYVYSILRESNKDIFSRLMQKTL